MKNRKLKEFVYKLDMYGFTQLAWFRKWYGGDWTKIAFRDTMDFDVWVKGDPDPYIVHDGVVDRESWQS